jgi:hypothetical protein
MPPTKPGIIVTLNKNRYHQAGPVHLSNTNDANGKQKRAPKLGGITVSKIKTSNDNDKTNNAKPVEEENESAESHHDQDFNEKSSPTQSRPASESHDDHTIDQRDIADVNENSMNDIPNQKPIHDNSSDIVDQKETQIQMQPTKPGIIVTLNKNRYHQAGPVHLSNTNDASGKQKRAPKLGGVTVSKIKRSDDTSAVDYSQSIVVSADDANEPNNPVTTVAV